MINRVIPPLNGVDGKTSVVGKESNTKSLTKMIVILRILRMMGVITLKFPMHPQILISSLSKLHSSLPGVQPPQFAVTKLRGFEMTK